LAKWGAFEFGRFDLTDWTPTCDETGATTWHVIKSSSYLMRPKGDISDKLYSRIEWRMAPSLDAGALSPQLLFRNASASLANSFLSLIPAELTGLLTNFDIVGRMFTPDACNPLMRHIYQGWMIARCDSPPTDFYMAALYRNQEDKSDVASIWHVNDGSRRKIIAIQLGNKINWSKPWHCRFNVSGRVLKAKWWSCEAIEPEQWDLHAEDSALMRPGKVGFSSTVHGGIKDNLWGIDWYAWSTDPDDPAPLYPDEDVP
jgi:hypothetical protein